MPLRERFLMKLEAAKHAAPIWPPAIERAAEFQVRQSATSSLVGKRPVAFFENASRPSTRISKTPPPDRRRPICAEGRSLRICSRTSRARGS